MRACQISGSVLPFAFAGSFGRCYRGNSGLVEGGRYFVNVVDGEEREYQTGKGGEFFFVNTNKFSNNSTTIL